MEEKIVNRHHLLESIENEYLNKTRPQIKIGDTVRVHTRIIEGQKERTQVFAGIVIAKKGKGASQTISVYRNAYDCSMERVVLLHSPNVSKIEVMKSGKVRRAKLYYLRGASGKAAKVEEKIMKKPKKVKQPAVIEAEKPVEKPVEE
jgi:large subunit ribosomal protein L19